MLSERLLNMQLADKPRESRCASQRSSRSRLHDLIAVVRLTCSHTRPQGRETKELLEDKWGKVKEKGRKMKERQKYQGTRDHDGYVLGMMVHAHTQKVKTIVVTPLKLLKNCSGWTFRCGFAHSEAAQTRAEQNQDINKTKGHLTHCVN